MVYFRDENGVFIAAGMLIYLLIILRYGRQINADMIASLISQQSLTKEVAKKNGSPKKS
jgi:hypothetical protein